MASADARLHFSCSEQCIEAYELLLALAESEQSLILGQFRAAGVGSSPGKCPLSSLSAIPHVVPTVAGIESSPRNTKSACQLCFPFSPMTECVNCLHCMQQELEWKPDHRQVKTNKHSWK
jgi:hypothetical protein